MGTRHLFEQNGQNQFITESVLSKRVEDDLHFQRGLMIIYHMFCWSVPHYFPCNIFIHVNIHHLCQPFLLIFTLQMNEALLPIQSPLTSIHSIPFKHCTCVQVITWLLTATVQFHWTLVMSFCTQTLPVCPFLFVVPPFIAIWTRCHLHYYRLLHHLHFHLFHLLYLTFHSQNLLYRTFPIFYVFFIFPTNVPFILFSVADSNTKLLFQPMFFVFQLNQVMYSYCSLNNHLFFIICII